jgi:glucose-1-phosphate cytidylyltransferase
MKVVLFCGGQGMRLRETSQAVPKPMVAIGDRPLLWHLMKYYSFYGHKDFLLCLGHGGDVIRQAFPEYKNEGVPNQLKSARADNKFDWLERDSADWRVGLVDTGRHSNVGQRLLRIRKFVDEEELFLANYADGLSDLVLPKLIDFFLRSGKIACFIGVRPTATFHQVILGKDGVVEEIAHIARSGSIINGGYFVFRREIFNYIEEGEDLVDEPFHRLIKERQLIAYLHDGFWACMDTFKDKQHLEDLHARGRPPWQVWMNGHAPGEGGNLC